MPPDLDAAEFLECLDLGSGISVRARTPFNWSTSELLFIPFEWISQAQKNRMYLLEMLEDLIHRIQNHRGEWARDLWEDAFMEGVDWAHEQTGQTGQTE